MPALPALRPLLLSVWICTYYALTYHTLRHVHITVVITQLDQNGGNVGEPESFKYKILLHAAHGQDAGQRTAGSSSRNSAVNYFRLALLMAYPGAQTLWTSAYSSKSRDEVDRRELDFFGLLAEMFNQREKSGDLQESFADYVRNPSCAYEDGKMLPNRVGPPLESDVPGERLSMDNIHVRTGSLDPEQFVDVDGAWVKEACQIIRTWCNRYAGEKVGFNASGNHDLSNKYDAWTEFCSRGVSTVMWLVDSLDLYVYDD
jgi:hypothetical protein